MGMYESDIELRSIAEETPSVWFVNIRSMLGYIQAMDNFTTSTGDLQATLEADPMTESNISANDWATGMGSAPGSRGEIIKWHDKMNNAYKSILNIDSNSFNSLHYLNSIITNVIDKMDAMAAAFDNNDFTSININDKSIRL